MLKMNSFIYPYTEQVKNLPVYLIGIGGKENQETVKRTGGMSREQILYCVDGRGCLKYDGKTVDIARGDIFFMPRGRAHEYFPYEKKWAVRWIVFDGSGIEALMRELGFEDPVVVHTDDLSPLQRLFDKIFITLRADRVYGNYLCSGLTYQFIMEFHRLSLDVSVPNGNIKNEILMSALNYIEDNLKTDFSVGELAAVSGVSQQYLGRLFRQAINASPAEYIIKRRIREAMRLLTETDMPIADISRICGFSSAGYFCAVFRKNEGMTPSAYRNGNK